MAVLIIESDPLVRDALELHFRQHPSIGIVVVDAVDGAFTQLEQLRFDAVILDASIPRAEEVIVHLEQKHPAPAVLLTISLADAANLEHFPRSAGLLALTKPTPLVILERGIELAIAYRRTLERNKSLEHTYHEQSNLNNFTTSAIHYVSSWLDCTNVSGSLFTTCRILFRTSWHCWAIFNATLRICLHVYRKVSS
jgi:DNA-binding NarL/FixJ family response regulator